MGFCAVFGCNNINNNHRGERIRLFRFPVNAKYRNLWIRACRRSDRINAKTASVCSVHFEKSAYKLSYRLKKEFLQISPNNQRILNSDAVPTLNLPSAPVHGSVSCSGSFFDDGKFYYLNNYFK